MRVLVEIVVILLLLGANGLFAMAEMAVVSSRKTRLRALAEQGNSKARLALNLAESPDRFLPTVQVGITVIGLLAGAFGGITIAKQLALALKAVPMLASSAEVIGVVVVVSGMTFLSLVIGELVPKRLALANPELMALRFARPVFWFSKLAGPPVRLLSATTNALLRLFPVSPGRKSSISDEEVKILVEEGTQAGVFHAAEPRMVESVLALDRLSVRSIMTPREKLVWVKQDEPHDALWHKIVVSGHSYYPVFTDSRDHAAGVVSVKAIYANLAAGVPVKVADVMTSPLLIPGDSNIAQLLDEFKKSGKHIAVVVDERGCVYGMVTLVDVLQAIVGDLPEIQERLKAEAKRRQDGTWLVDGRFESAKLDALLGRPVIEPIQPGRLTVAEFVRDHLRGEIREGAWVAVHGLTYEIIDMDGQRIDKVLVTPLFEPLVQLQPGQAGTGVEKAA